MDETGLPDVNIGGNRVSPPAVSLSNRAPAWGAPGHPDRGWSMGNPGFSLRSPQQEGNDGPQGRSNDECACQQGPHLRRKLVGADACA